MAKVPPEPPERDGHSPWAMARICRTVHAEVAPLLNSINMADILFDFDQFTVDEMRHWICLPSADRSGEERVQGIRQWSLNSWAYCERATYYNACTRLEDIEECGSEDDMKEFDDQLLQYVASDPDRKDYLLMDLSLFDAKRMRVAAYCGRYLNVDFASIKPQTEDDICNFEMDESVCHGDSCGHGSDSCQEGTNCDIFDAWDIDREAWLRDGQPTVTGDQLVRLLHALGKASMK
ncbi:hypothetical protein PG988_006246 [Apiospora saccharicola]